MFNNFNLSIKQGISRPCTNKTNTEVCPYTENPIQYQNESCISDYSEHTFNTFVL